MTRAVDNMSYPTTFAYMLFACNWNMALAAELSDWFWADFVEASLSTEDQATEPEDVWAYDFDYGLRRIAPVQLTLGWDPRPPLLQAFLSENMAPIFESPRRGEKNWFVFPTPPRPLQWPDREALHIPKTIDYTRLQAVLSATVELISERNGHLLFVSGEGFDYHVNAAHLQKNAPLLRKTSMKFFDRHP